MSLTEFTADLKFFTFNKNRNKFLNLRKLLETGSFLPKDEKEDEIIHKHEYFIRFVLTYFNHCIIIIYLPSSQCVAKLRISRFKAKL